MSKDLHELALRLESLLPAILRQLYPNDVSEPLSELPLMQLRVVRCLSDGPKSLSALGSELQMSPSRLAHLLSRLEDSGLVERQEDPKDRRNKSAGLTESGTAQMNQRRQLRSARLRDVLETMSEYERTSVIRALEVLHEKSGSKGLVPLAAEIEPALP